MNFRSIFYSYCWSLILVSIFEPSLNQVSIYGHRTGPDLTHRYKYVENKFSFSYSEDLRQRRLEIKDLLILLFSFIVHASFRVKEILKLERKKKIARNGFLNLFLSDPTNNFFLNLFLSSVIVYISNLFLS